MVLNAKVVTYTAPVAIGNQTLTGVGFTPKTAIIWFTPGNNAADTFIEGFGFGFGFTDGTNSRCYSNVSEDNQATSDCARIARDDALIVSLNQTGTLTTEDARASFSSFNGDGMVINWSDAPAAAFKFHILYLGGDELRAKVGDITVSANGTVTTSGIGFPPQIVFAVSGHNTAFNTAVGNGSSFCLGVVGTTYGSTGGRGCAGFVSEGARTTMDTWQFMNIGAPIIDMNATTGAIFNILLQNPTLDIDGFTFTASSFSVTTIKSYLALGGGIGCHCTSDVEPSSTGLQVVKPPSNFLISNPPMSMAKAVIIFGTDTGTLGSVQVDNMYTFGVATNPNESVVTVMADLDNAADSACTTRYETDSIYLNITPNATATSSTVDDEANIDSFIEGGFVLNWTNVGNARRFFYVVLFDSPDNPHSYGKIHTHYDNNAGGAMFG